MSGQTGTFCGGTPSAAQIAALQKIREYPAISVLVTTTPAAVLGAEDALRLDALAGRAVHRVRGELCPATAAPAVERLNALLALARRGPAARALALYASASTQALIRLPIPVHDREAVDPTFATRDLVRARQRIPPYCVLALSPSHARLFEAVNNILLPAPTCAFPMHVAHRIPHRGSGPADRPTHTIDHDDFYRDVDAALSAYLRRHPVPFVLVGDGRAAAGFQLACTNHRRLVGTVRGNLSSTPARELSTRIHSALDAYLNRRQAEAVALIARRASAGRVASGMPAAWLAARTRRPEMLAVDESLFYPARISDDGDTLIPAVDVEHPDVIDDAVDELIELVLARGGRVAFTTPGALAEHHHGVAVTIR
ncbi:hypothetical protein GCM10023322_12840 [Rugosimonospora acidiphila]|uniref:Uncharacterized protein n=1 Tax=Rugosimonospora acidiphila TaxID=556531 RepID=A0ABP9RML3_9ACTN